MFYFLYQFKEASSFACCPGVGTITVFTTEAPCQLYIRVYVGNIH